MFGYVIPSINALPPHEQVRYRAAYCGLCHRLAKQNGQLCRLSLSYDLVFMALVLNSLYELPEESGEMRCPLHPAKTHLFATSKAFDYAADLSVALVYHKMADDWYDDLSAKARAAMATLNSAYKEVAGRRPKQCAEIESAMNDIRALEEQAKASQKSAAVGYSLSLRAVSPDAAANRFGLLLGNLFAWQDDFWADGLRLFGARLGKFVYVMDAAMDLEADLQTGSYNPFAAMGTDPNDTRDVLEMLAAAVADAFERLPLERDEHLLRSVLYEGMWTKYNAQFGADAAVAGEAASDEASAVENKVATDTNEGGAA